MFAKIKKFFNKEDINKEFFYVEDEQILGNREKTFELVNKFTPEKIFEVIMRCEKLYFYMDKKDNYNTPPVLFTAKSLKGDISVHINLGKKNKNSRISFGHSTFKIEGDLFNILSHKLVHLYFDYLILSSEDRTDLSLIPPKRESLTSRLLKYFFKRDETLLFNPNFEISDSFIDYFISNRKEIFIK